MGLDIFKDLGIGAGSGKGLSLSDKNRLIAIANTAADMSTPIMTDLASVVGSPVLSTDDEPTMITNIQNAKNTMATNITALGQTAAGTDALAVLATKVGSVPKRGAVTITPSTTNQTITAGYHNGSGYVVGDADLVTGNIKAGANIFGVAGKTSVVDTATATAANTDILSGKTAYVNGSLVTGNIPVNPGLIAASNHIAAASISVGNYSPDGQQRIYMRPGIASARQILDGDVWVSTPEPNLVGSNILSGKSIFGVVGTAAGKDGNGWDASGTVSTVIYNSSYNLKQASITGLKSDPKVLFMTIPSTATSFLYINFKIGTFTNGYSRYGKYNENPPNSGSAYDDEALMIDKITYISGGYGSYTYNASYSSGTLTLTVADLAATSVNWYALY